MVLVDQGDDAAIGVAVAGIVEPAASPLGRPAGETHHQSLADHGARAQGRILVVHVEQPGVGLRRGGVEQAAAVLRAPARCDLDVGAARLREPDAGDVRRAGMGGRSQGEGKGGRQDESDHGLLT